MRIKPNVSDNNVPSSVEKNKWERALYNKAEYARRKAVVCSPRRAAAVLVLVFLAVLAIALVAAFARPELEQQVQHILTRHSGPIIIAGDININMNANSTATEQFQQLLRGYSLQQHIAGPTFRASGSTIDVIVTNQQSVSKAGVVHCDYSPHNWSRVLMSVPDLRLQKCTITTRCWSSMVPEKRVRVRNPVAPPVTDATKELMAQRRAALRDGHRDAYEYKQLNRQVQSAVRRDTREELDRRNMTFSAHIDDVVRRCTGILCGLNHSRHCLPQSTLARLMEGLVLSIVRYSCLPSTGVVGPTTVAPPVATRPTTADGEPFPWDSLRLPSAVLPRRYELLLQPNLTTFAVVGQKFQGHKNRRSGVFEAGMGASEGWAAEQHVLQHISLFSALGAKRDGHRLSGHCWHAAEGRQPTRARPHQVHRNGILPGVLRSKASLRGLYDIRHRHPDVQFLMTSHLNQGCPENLLVLTACC
ncbi:Leucyl-cystinyl aminopeptidase [Amphibalanus amphitrite]|uniref:Leucyl-cystinyl aminopeptidase n=1 Tax=Amphibalanus amphitrite TaxID=1232801 RepID=A0A6A4XE13_AMPAM|nr:Leucyl-cystinyl aminopeptidase [Amphibalanus amphitrite]